MAEETEEVKIQEEDDHLFAQRQDVMQEGVDGVGHVPMTTPTTKIWEMNLI